MEILKVVGYSGGSVGLFSLFGLYLIYKSYCMLSQQQKVIWGRIDEIKIVIEEIKREEVRFQEKFKNVESNTKDLATSIRDIRESLMEIKNNYKRK